MRNGRYIFRNDKLYRVVSEDAIEYRVRQLRQTFHIKFDTSVCFEESEADNVTSYSRYEVDRSAKITRIAKGGSPVYEVKGFDVASSYVKYSAPCSTPVVKVVHEEDYPEDMFSARIWAVTHNVSNLFLKHVGINEWDIGPATFMNYYYAAMEGHDIARNNEVNEMLVKKVKEYDELMEEILAHPRTEKLRELQEYVEKKRNSIISDDFHYRYVRRFLMNPQPSVHQTIAIRALKPQTDGFREGSDFTKEELFIGVGITRICRKNEGSYMGGMRVRFSEERARAILDSIVNGGDTSAY